MIHSRLFLVAFSGLSALLGTFTWNVNAADSLCNHGLCLSSASTSTSTLLIEGQVGADISQVLFVVSSRGGHTEAATSTQQSATPRGGIVAEQILLQKGPGLYTIKVYACPQNTTSCSLFAKFSSISNSDTRDPSEIRLSATNGYQLNADSTSDSTVRIQGAYPEEALLMLIIATHASTGQTSRTQVAPDNHHLLSTKLYLRNGPGLYQIQVFSCGESGSCQSVNLTPMSVLNTDPRGFNPTLLPSSEIQSDDDAIRDLANQLTTGLTTDRERTEAIHNWVAKEIAYDTEAFFSGQYSRMPWDALTVLTRKTAVCAGYASLTAALLRAAGIPAKRVTGAASSVYSGSDATAAANTDNSCNHAWNEVLLDGKWVPLDTTWDAGYVSFANQKFTFSFSSKYFLPAPDEFARTHRKCEDDKN